MRFTIILDACVLYPTLLRDLLMHLSMTGLFKPKYRSWIVARVAKVQNIKWFIAFFGKLVATLRV